MQTAAEWACQQWATVELGDARLTQRAVRMGAKMAAHPEESLPNQMGKPSELKAAYRVLNHDAVTLEALTAPHRQETLRASQHAPVVLMVEDTTELDFTAHRSKTGLGPIGDGNGRGMLLHSTLAVLPETRAIVGLAHVQVVLRQPRSEQKWARSPEGLLWEVSAQRVGAPDPGVTWVHVSDAGSDNFAYMATCVALGKDFLVRAQYNRVLHGEVEQPEAQADETRKLFDYVRSLPLVEETSYTVEVSAQKQQPRREARVALAWTQVVLRPSTQAPPEVRQHGPITAWVVRVAELDAPADVEPLEWILITSLPVLNAADARQMVEWYTCRWLCEDYHQCLKTGCQVEQSQLDDGADIRRLLGFLVPLAVRLLQLRQAVRHTPDRPAIEVVKPLLVQVLTRLTKGDWRTLSVSDFWRQVAQLGGHQGRRRDGPPGWRTLWRGWLYLADVTEGARLFAAPDSAEKCG